MDSQEKNITPPVFTVKRIKVLNFFFSENGLPAEAVYRIDFGHEIQVNSQMNLVALELRVFYILENEDPSKNRIVLDCTVQNAFDVQNLSMFVEGENQIRLPNETIISFVSLAISHTRALLATLTAGTMFQESLLPIINPVEAAKAFFPEKNNENFVLTPGIK